MLADRPLLEFTPQAVFEEPHLAHQLRGLRRRHQAGRLPDRRHQRVPQAPRLFRLGGAEGRDARRADQDAAGVRPARPGGRGRAPRPPAAEDRGVRRHGLRRAADGRGRRRQRARGGRGRRLRRPELRALCPQSHEGGFPRRARALGARAAPAQARPRVRLMRCSTRSSTATFQSSTRSRPSSRRSRTRSSSRISAAPTSRGCTRSSARSASSSMRSGRCRKRSPS